MAPGIDRISRLPTDILDHILGFLSIEEAAKTAVLSTVWRDVWSSLTKLNFDDHFLGYIDKKYHCFRKSTGLYLITKILLQHNGTIRQFGLNFNDVKMVRTRPFDYNQWLLLVTRKGVEEICLSVAHDVYRVHNCIFSCITLKRLHLCGVLILPLEFPRILPNVVSLCFQSVLFCPTNREVCALDVPVLETLSFLWCKSMFCFNITAPKLISLTIESCSSGMWKRSPFLPINLDLRSICTLDFHGSLKVFCLTISFFIGLYYYYYYL